MVPLIRWVSGVGRGWEWRAEFCLGCYTWDLIGHPRRNVKCSPVCNSEERLGLEYSCQCRDDDISSHRSG